MADSGSRTEPATPARRAEARRRGAVVVSPEAAPTAALVAGLGVATVAGPALVRAGRLVIADWLAAAGSVSAHGDGVAPLAWRSAAALVPPLASVLLAVAAVGVGAVVAQVGWRPDPRLVAPDPARLRAAAGWRRIAWPHGAAALVKAMVKVALVLAVTWRILVSMGGDALDAAALPVDGIVALAGRGLERLGLALAAALALVVAGDYAWRRWLHERGLRMSRHELREEQRQSDGDPHVRRRLRRARRVRRTASTLADVAPADLVVADPGAVAVAIRFRPEEDRAPRVLAKGVGDGARRIERAAREGGVPIVERRALARTLVRAVALGDEVPASLYRAVAEILAYVRTAERPTEGPAS